MKTIKNLIILTICLVSLQAFSERKGVQLSPEKYINDIPFNTRLIAANTMIDSDKYLPELQNEQYVDDIPFNTRAIARKVKRTMAMERSLELKEESFVDDIPFNTWKVTNEYWLDNYALQDEKPAQDIPYNTEIITSAYLVNSIDLALCDEENVNDISLGQYLYPELFSFSCEENIKFVKKEVHFMMNNIAEPFVNPIEVHLDACNKYSEMKVLCIENDWVIKYVP